MDSTAWLRIPEPPGLGAAGGDRVLLTYLRVRGNLRDWGLVGPRVFSDGRLR